LILGGTLNSIWSSVRLDVAPQHTKGSTRLEPVVKCQAELEEVTSASPGGMAASAKT